MKTQTIRTLITIALLVVTTACASGDGKGRLAVLEITNTTGGYAAFVRSMPEMIVTELMQKTSETLVERSQVKAAMQELGLENNGITTDGGVKIGQWVGADRVLVGSLSQINGVNRLDLRIIEVASGKILAASQASVADDLQQLVPRAVESLARSLSPKETLANDPANTLQRAVPDRPERFNGSPQTRLHITHKVTLSLFTEKPVPFQVVKVYLDSRLLGTSGLLDSVNKDYALLDQDVPAGPHMLRLEHCVVTRSGVLKRDLEEQPAELEIDLPPGGETNLHYEMRVGTRNFEFKDFIRE